MMSKSAIAMIVGTVMLAGCAANVKPDQTSATVCQPIDEAQVASLFERWNRSLKTGEPKQVVQNYAESSILLPTLSGKNRVTQAEKEEYFKHFLQQKPQGVVTERQIDIGCNVVVDSGLYTFTMGRTGKKVPARFTYTYKWENGQWLITSHHSSLQPKK